MEGTIFSDEDASSPLKTVATLAGIAIILLLGGVFWSSVGAMAAAWNDALMAFPAGRPTPQVVLEPVSGPIPTVAPSPSPTAVPALVEASPSPSSTPTPQPTMPPAPTSTLVSSPTPALTPTPTTVPAAATSTAEPTDGERIPWVLLPQPEPGSRVAPGTIVIEARGRGDAPVVEIRLELDGAALPVTLDQRGDAIVRGKATATIGVGHHAARAVVVDAKGRSGAFRWSFDGADQ